MKKSVTAFLAALMFLVLFFSACNEKTADTTNKESNANAAVASDVKSAVKPQPDAQVAVIETADYGRIVIELYPNVAPKMVERFKKLISEKFYDGTAIHRVDPSLGIIQGGDPLTKGNNTAVYGTGNSPFTNVGLWAPRGPVMSMAPTASGSSRSRSSRPLIRSIRCSAG